MIIESSVHYIDLFLMLEHFHNEGLKKNSMGSRMGLPMLKC